MSEQDRYMLIFTLGPAQLFIQQARKTRDLWIGSLLLAKLMEAAMDGIKGTFVFPDGQAGSTSTIPKTKVEEIPDIPNKYIALFDDSSQAQRAAQQSQKQITELWRDICDKVWQRVIVNHADEETQSIWLRQTGINPRTHQVNQDAFFEVYWAIIERQVGHAYGEWFEAAKELLEARKRLRNFGAKEEPGEKSAISGEREVLRRKGTSPKEVQQFWEKIAGHHSAKDINQEGKEHLDAIDTVKRFAMEADAIIINKRPFQMPFPSTSFIATASFVEKLIEMTSDFPPHVLQEWRTVTKGKLESKEKEEEARRTIPFFTRKASSENAWLLRRDGDLYFTETFVPRRLKEEYDVPTSEGEELAKRGSNALRALLRTTDEHKITRPTPYYAVIQMDGDNMGILLSGVKEETEHGKISLALSSFAREIAPGLVEQQYPARLVYAGGDDVLAFAPLARDKVEGKQPQHILNLAYELQSEYKKTVIDALPKTLATARRDKVTASAGIVIAHHYTSLSYVLRSARETEDSAKKRYGKNALVVTLIRRSGEQTRVGCRWHYPELAEDGQPIELFSRFYQFFKDDVLSPKCVHTLLEEAPALVGLERSAQRSEVKRVLARQLSDHLSTEQQLLLLNPKNQPANNAPLTSEEKKRRIAEQIKTLAEQIVALAEAMDQWNISRAEEKPSLSVELHNDILRYGLVEVLGWLLVMAFLARKELE